MNPIVSVSLEKEKLIFRGNNRPHNIKLPDTPPWRRFDNRSRNLRGAQHRATDSEINAVNIAIYLRRPLLITGKPGTGKTSLAHAVAHELKLGNPFIWHITSRTTLERGLYEYDAIGRLQDASLTKEASERKLIGFDLRLMSVDTADDLLDEGNSLVIVAEVGAALHIRIFNAGGKMIVDKAAEELVEEKTEADLADLKERLNPFPDESHLSKNEKKEIVNSVTSIAGLNDDAPSIGKYIRLGPVGAALCCSKPKRPAVLLIDEIDKSDIDLPNDLLHIFEEGEFIIPELTRLPDDEKHHVINVGLPSGDETVPIERGRVVCREFPIVFLTSNGERDFPPAFLRRCLRLDIPQPNENELAEIVRRRLEEWYDLRLMSIDTTDDLVREGHSLVVVALVGPDLHIRIFNAGGELIFDKATSELEKGETNADLVEFKKQLSPLPDESKLSKKKKKEIVGLATSIAGLTQDINHEPKLKKLLEDFVEDRDQKKRQLATDQLLNAVVLVRRGLLSADHPDLKRYVLRDLSDIAL